MVMEYIEERQTPFYRIDRKPKTGSHHLQHRTFWSPHPYLCTLKLTPPNTHFSVFSVLHINTHTHINPQGGRSAAGSCCEKHPRGISESTDPLRLRMCQYVNMCIWMHCSVFLFSGMYCLLTCGLWCVLLTSTWLHRALLGAEFINGLFDYAEQSRRIMIKSSVFKKKNYNNNHVWCLHKVFLKPVNCTWHQTLKIYFSYCCITYNH